MAVIRLFPRRTRGPRGGALEAAAGLGVLALIAAGIGLVAAPHSITGAPAWLKPAKFAVSIAAYTLTLAWLLTLVRGHRRLVRSVAVSTAVALSLELLLIVLQVVRGTSSHFNDATPLDAAIFAAMGALVVIVFAAALATATVLTRQQSLTGAIGTAVRAGIAIAVLGMAEAVLMLVNTSVHPGGAHTVGAADGGPGLPLTGWSTEHGDLRVAHFAGLHALQVLPLIAYCLGRFTAISAGRQRSVMRAIAAGYACIVALLAWQAERGLPLLRPDAAVTAVAAGIILTCVGLVVRALRTGGTPAETPALRVG